MSENSRMLISWTPSSTAASQKVYRSGTSTGPWTLLATLGATADSYVDSTVDPTPQTPYYYKIETICTNGSAQTTYLSDVSKNCPTGGRTYLFGLRNRGTQSTFTYHDSLNLYSNTYYSTSLDYPRTFNIGTNTPIHVVCQKCGQSVTHNGTQDNAAYTYLSEQGHIVKYLPASPTAFGGSANSNAGNMTQKLLYGNIGPQEGRYILGVGQPASSTFVGWNGGYVSANNNTSVSTSGLSWNYGEVPSSTGVSNGGFTGIRISRKDWDGSSVGSNNYSSALSALTGNNVYVTIFDESYLAAQNLNSTGGLICEHYIYKLTRKPDWDYPSTGTVTHYGFQMTRYTYVDHNGYRVFSGFTDNAFKPYSYNDQPIAYLKIFTL